MLVERVMSVPVERLSPRQRECLRLAYQRRTTKEIARELGIRPGTVATYCSEAIAILGADNRRHAAELLHGLERGPSDAGGELGGVEDGDRPVATAARSGRPAHFLGPLAPANRDADNDHSITIRLAWIICLAIGLAVGFSSIVNALRIISDVFR